MESFTVVFWLGVVLAFANIGAAFTYSLSGTDVILILTGEAILIILLTKLLEALGITKR